VRTCRGDIAA